MNKQENARYYRDKANRILREGVEGTKIDQLYRSRNPLVTTVLYLLEDLGLQTYPVDDAYLESHPGEELAYLSRSQKIRMLPLELEEDWWNGRDMGAFLGWRKDADEESPVACLPGPKGYTILNVSDHTKTPVTSSNAEQISRDALFLYPDTAARSMGIGQVMLFSVRKNLGGILFFLLFSICYGLLSTALPGMMSHFVSSLIPRKEVGQVILYAVMLLCFILAGVITGYISGKLRSAIQVLGAQQVMFLLFDKLMRVSPSSVRRWGSSLMGDLMEAQYAVVEMIGNAFVFFMSLVLSVFTYRKLLLSGSRFGSSVSFLSILILLALLTMFVPYYRISKHRKDADVRLLERRMEMLAGIESIRNSADEEIFYYRHAVLYDEARRAAAAGKGIQGYVSLTIAALYGIGMLLILPSMAEEASLDLQVFTTYTCSLALFVSYAGMLVQSVAMLMGSIAKKDVLLKIFSEAAEETPGDKPVGEISGAISIEKLHFRYHEKAPEVLHDITVSIKAGEYIGIVGTSGCGKSTLLRLLMGFEKPTEGYIYYDNYNLAQARKKDLRKRFGVVLQDAKLLGGSIKMNISGEEDPDMDAVVEAARKAAILDEIEAMPMQFNTVIQAEASTISGGQRQRILIARALMANPKVLFLDEATSALDNFSQEMVQESLKNLPITRIVVAHRLSTIRDCDRILVMDHGRIAESGTYDELMEKKGIFYDLAKRNMA